MIRFITGMLIISVVSITSTVASYEETQWWATAVWAVIGANAGFWVAWDGVKSMVHPNDKSK